MVKDMWTTKTMVMRFQTETRTLETRRVVCKRYRLSKNFSTICPCSESLSAAELKSKGLIFLIEYCVPLSEGDINRCLHARDRKLKAKIGTAT